MSSLPDVERDASEVVQILAAVAALLGRRTTGPDDDTRLMLDLVATAGASAERVLEYLRVLQGSGDGVAVAVPPRLGQWRDWVPPRGHVLGEAACHEAERFPRRQRRCDPGE